MSEQIEKCEKCGNEWRSIGTYMDTNCFSDGTISNEQWTTYYRCGCGMEKVEETFISKLDDGEITESVEIRPAR